MIFLNDARSRRNGMREPDVAADDGATANDRLAAEDSRARVDNNIVFYRQVPLGVANQLALGFFVEGESAEVHALIELDVVAYTRGAAYDYASAVVYEEVRAYLRARMNVY